VTGDFCSLDGSGKRVRDRTIGEMEQVCQQRSFCYGYCTAQPYTGQHHRLLQHVCPGEKRRDTASQEKECCYPHILVCSC
jgi:hypothetical protein